MTARKAESGRHRERHAVLSGTVRPFVRPAIAGANAAMRQLRSSPGARSLCLETGSSPAIEQNFADMVSAVEVSVRVGDILEREHSVDRG